MEMKLKKPQIVIYAGRIFSKAVRGYKFLKKKKPFTYGPGIIPPDLWEKLMGKKKEEEKEKPKGVSVTGVAGPIRLKQEEFDLTKIDLRYPLIPRSEPAFAYARINWVPAERVLVYHVIEPELSQPEKELLAKIKAALIEKLDVDFTTLRKEETKDYLRKKFEEMLNVLAAGLSPQKKSELLYYIERDFIGLEKIEPLMQDTKIEDISCDGVGIPIFVFHRESHFGTIKTDIMFDSGDDLDRFVNKLTQRCGKSISIAAPLVDASLPDGSRLQATLGTDIARRGSNFTVRKFTEKPLTPIDLMKWHMFDSKVAAYIWLCIEYGRSMLVTGGTATGKTSLLNAFSLFIKPDAKIISIEDTPEIRLPHPHWISGVARQPIAEMEGKKIGEVDLFDLLKESLRQRPDFLIVGEVRGKEAYVLFQQIATGHSSMSTIHADSMERLMDRLTTPPISLPPNLIEALDVIVFATRIKHGNTYVRRISSIHEIVGFDREKNIPITNEVFRWNPTTDQFDEINPSIVLQKIIDQYGISPDFIHKEISTRMRVLSWMTNKDITDFNDVARIISMYYTKTDEMLKSIGA